MSAICSCITVNHLNNTIFGELMEEMEPDVYMFAKLIQLAEFKSASISTQILINPKGKSQFKGSN